MRMNERMKIYIWRVETFTQKHACSQRQMHMAHAYTKTLKAENIKAIQTNTSTRSPTTNGSLDPDKCVFKMNLSASLVVCSI